MKTCSKCKINKKLIDFYKKSASKDGYRSECKECNNKSSKVYKINWYNANKERLKENKDSESAKLYLVEYKKKNKEKINHWRKKYRDNKFSINPVYKLSHNIRCLISKYLNKLGYIKSEKTESILGCSFEEFKSYIESQFREGMSWENHGKWHLDHKTPISWAKSEEMVLELNHYTNFQPLWAKDNLVKGNKYSD
jgi:hypothetical protein